MAREDVRFWHPLEVRYRDVDMQHVVYFGVYLEYFDDAIIAYLRALDVEISDAPGATDFDYDVVHVEVDYAHPARFGDRLEIGVRVERLGRSSVEIALAARRAGAGEHLCTGRFVIVSFDRRVGQAVPIPERVREAIAAYEGLAG